MVWPRAAGSSSVLSVPAEGPVLTGITVTVVPGRSSRSLAGVASVLAGWTIGWGAAGAAVEDQTAASRTLGSSGMERRAVRCWIRTRWIALSVVPSPLVQSLLVEVPTAKCLAMGWSAALPARQFDQHDVGILPHPLEHHPLAVRRHIETED
jgi:hypothetical protein